MWKNKLKFEPMDSPKLNEKLKSHPINNPEQTYEYLLSLWIHEDFIDSLNDMFDDIKASTAEIMWAQNEIVAANNRIEEQVELSRVTKTNLAVMKNAA
jgi:hypothetical protein